MRVGFVFITIMLIIATNAQTEIPQEDRLNLHEGKKGDSIHRTYQLSSDNFSSLELILIQPGPAPATYSVNVTLLPSSNANISIKYELDVSSDGTGVKDAIFSSSVTYLEIEGNNHVDYFFNMTPNSFVYQKIDENFNCYDCETAAGYEISLSINGSAELDIVYKILNNSKMVYAFANYPRTLISSGFIVLIVIRNYDRFSKVR